MSIKVDLLIIDPQFDFCDPSGSLYVNGADQDMERVAKMIKRIGPKINDIHVTLDTHHYVDVAHPIYLKDSSGNHPDPFTIITKDEVKNGKWATTLPSLQKRFLDYVTQLENNGKYPLCIWPPHCLIGSKGHMVYPSVFDALLEWEKSFAMVDYVTKGSNLYTEHYSAIRADVPDPSDPSTQLNTALIQVLTETDKIAIMGEASSHCVKNTLYDIIDAFGDESYVKKFVLIEDGMSPVTGFEQLADDMFNDLKSRGVEISTTDNFLT